MEGHLRAGARTPKLGKRLRLLLLTEHARQVGPHPLRVVGEKRERPIVIDRREDEIERRGAQRRRNDAIVFSDHCEVGRLRVRA